MADHNIESSEKDFSSSFSLNLPRIIAHRGASAYAPENTMAAFSTALKNGATWIECDVRLTRDNELVILHDSNLKRTTGVNSRCRQNRLSFIKECDAGRWFSRRFADERIPTLSELMQFLQINNMGVNLELKVRPSQAKLMARELVSQLLAFQDKVPILISSSSTAVLESCRQEGLMFAQGLLVSRWSRRKLSSWQSQSFFSINLSEKIATKPRVQACVDHGFKVLVYTINKPEVAEKLFEWGVSSVFSDYPDLMQRK